MVDSRLETSYHYNHGFVYRGPDGLPLQKQELPKYECERYPDKPGEEMTDNLSSPESRKSMVKLVIKLFETWKLPVADQLNLLGLSETSRAMLAKYCTGTAIPNSRDMDDRVGLLLSIHKSLRLLYPYNQDFRYQWVSKRNQMMNNLRPIEIMKEKGIIGIATVTRHLDFLRGQ